MIGGEWKDVSSYSQSDKVREPWCFECVTAGVRIVVSRSRDYPGQWLTHADWALTLTARPAGDNLVEAQRSAIIRVRRACKQILAATAPSVQP